MTSTDQLAAAKRLKNNADLQIDWLENGRYPLEVLNHRDQPANWKKFVGGGYPYFFGDHLEWRKAIIDPHAETRARWEAMTPVELIPSNETRKDSDKLIKKDSDGRLWSLEYGTSIETEWFAFRRHDPAPGWFITCHYRLVEVTPRIIPWSLTDHPKGDVWVRRKCGVSKANLLITGWDTLHAKVDERWHTHEILSQEWEQTDGFNNLIGPCGREEVQ